MCIGGDGVFVHGGLLLEYVIVELRDSAYAVLYEYDEILHVNSCTYAYVKCEIVL